MNSYYCPFCSSRYQVHKTRSDGVLICGHCGDPLIKITLLNSRRIIGLLASLAFLAPLLFMFIYVVEDFNKEKRPNNYELLGLVNILK